MDILKQIKDIDIASRCNNRVFYENIILWFEDNYTHDDDCKIYRRIKEIQEECKPYIKHCVTDSMYYYPFRLKVLSEYDLMTEDEYITDIEMLSARLGNNHNYDFWRGADKYNLVNGCMNLWIRLNV